MLELIAAALLQIASLTASPDSQTQAIDGGSGGWGHDIVSTEQVAAQPTSPTAVDGGSGGWGHD